MDAPTQVNHKNSDDIRWLQATGEMADRIRQTDWSRSPLGPSSLWPQSLRSALELCLGSKFPMFIWWGDEHRVFYNDSYIQFAAPNKHPQFFGQPAREMWAEIWDVVGPLTEQVRSTGIATWSENLPLSLLRKGFLEETYFTFSYSPVRDESGRINGVFCAVQETTERVAGDRRLNVLRELGAHEARTDVEAALLSAQALATNPQDIPFSLIYLIGSDGKKLTLAGSSGIRPGSLDSSFWPLAEVFRSRVPERVSGLRARLGKDLPRTPWKEGPDSAIVFPLSRSRHEDPMGFLVLGISPRLECAGGYLEFFNMVSHQIATRIANARLRLEAEEERARLDRVIQNTPVVFWAVDQNGIFTLSVGKALQDLGLQPNEIVGKCHYDLYKNYPEAIALVKRALQGESFSAATTIQGRVLETNYTPLRDPQGQINGVVAISTDITARMLAQKEAEVERQRLHRLLMEAPVGICVLEGLEHRFSLVNPTYYAVLFGENRNFVGKTIREALPELAGQGFYELLDRVYQTGESVIGTEMPADLKLADGTVKQLFVNFIYQAKRDAEGRIDGILVVVYDVTELVVERRRTEHALQSRDEFLSIASHELKTPLTSLQLETHLAKRRLGKDESMAAEMPWMGKLVNQTEKSIQRLTRLVDDMLDVSRIATGNLTLLMETFDLCELAQEIADRMQAHVQAAETTLTLVCCDSASGNWDRFRIDQVITNLLTNAIRYGRGSPIEMSVSRDHDQAVLSVRDQGPGILPQNRERIFQRFERGAAATGISGLGLGLFICREIIERHGGQILLESEPGKGATFKILLPLTRSA